VVAPAAPYAGCNSCNSCDSGCGCESEGFFARLRHRFASSNDCGCNQAPSCGCESEGFFSRFKGHKGSSSCDCGCSQAPSCGCESGPGFWERLKGRFHHEECCDTGCSSCGCNQGPAVAPVGPGVSPAGPPGEPIKPPKDTTDPGKKLPEGSYKPKDKAAQAPLPFQVAPVSTKVIEKDNKNPF